MSQVLHSENVILSALTLSSPTIPLYLCCCIKCGYFSFVGQSHLNLQMCLEPCPQ